MRTNFTIPYFVVGFNGTDQGILTYQRFALSFNRIKSCLFQSLIRSLET